jgi:hypothetical protein
MWSGGLRSSRAADGRARYEQWIVDGPPTDQPRAPNEPEFDDKLRIRSANCPCG